MLQPADLDRVASRFGVAEDQVRRDHLISHVLAALADVVPEIVFFGGTALARTHLPDGRLSEDIDLYAADRRSALLILDTALPQVLRREFPGIRWDPPPTAVRRSGAASLVPANAPSVRVQVLDRAGYVLWPTERRPVEVRYTDVRPASLVVPTRAAFVGMKVWAWIDRAAPRDLYDLWALALIGAVDGAAAGAFARAVGYRPGPRMFGTAPAERAWREGLAHQTAVLPAPEEALATVREAVAAA